MHNLDNLKHHIMATCMYRILGVVDVFRYRDSTPVNLKESSDIKLKVLSRAMKKVAADFNKTRHLVREDCCCITLNMKLYFFDRCPKADREDLIVCNRVIVRGKRELTMKELEDLRASLSACLRDGWGYRMSRTNVNGYRFKMRQYARCSKFKKVSWNSPRS